MPQVWFKGIMLSCKILKNQIREIHIAQLRSKIGLASWTPPPCTQYDVSVITYPYNLGSKGCFLSPSTDIYWTCDLSFFSTSLERHPSSKVCFLFGACLLIGIFYLLNFMLSVNKSLNFKLHDQKLN